MRRRGVAAMLISGLLLQGCSQLFPNKYRYRMTVSIETPEGVRQGSAVREITYREELIHFPDAPRASATENGEAVAVHLSDGRVVFALLPINPYRTMQLAFGDDSNETLRAAQRDRRIVTLHDPASDPNRVFKDDPFNTISGFPRLVYFVRPHDRWSAKALLPGTLANTLGKGIKLKSVTVQMTVDPVTTGIAAELPSTDARGFYNYDDKSNPHEPDIVSRSDFFHHRSR